MRRDDITHSMVHYLFAIHKLREKQGYARATDIAKDLKLSKGSVSIAVGGLKKKGLVLEDDNRFLLLSKKGHKITHEILGARTLLYYFFKDFLKVSDKKAMDDACKIEHLLSEESQIKLFEFMKDVICSKTKSCTISNVDLKFCDFENLDNFRDSQEGDSCPS